MKGDGIGLRKKERIDLTQHCSLCLYSMSRSRHIATHPAVPARSISESSSNQSSLSLFHFASLGMILLPHPTCGRGSHKEALLCQGMFLG
jgi:hypothetical protein